jgi:hypothetical protein
MPQREIPRAPRMARLGLLISQDTQVVSPFVGDAAVVT